MQDLENSVRYWHTANALPDEVFSLMRKANRAISPIAVVATVNADGTPHTAPFASLRAVTPTLLRMICFRYHHTFSNLNRNENLMVSFLAPPTTAVSIRGRAEMIKENMDADENYAIFNIHVDEVKNDMVKTVVIESPVTISARFEYKDWFEKALEELEAVN